MENLQEILPLRERLLKSYGPMIVLLPYLRQTETVSLQQVSKFMYNIGVSRVQIVFCIRRAPIIILCPGFKEMQLYELRFKAGGKFSLKYKQLPSPYNTDLTSCVRMVQIGFKAYAIVGSTNISKCIELESDKIDQMADIRCSEKADLLHTRWGHSACASDNGTHLVVTGNMPQANDDLSFTKKTERYSIKEDKWVELAEMNYSRSQHASCSI